MQKYKDLLLLTSNRASDISFPIVNSISPAPTKFKTGFFLVSFSWLPKNTLQWLAMSSYLSSLCIFMEKENYTCVIKRIKKNTVK